MVAKSDEGADKDMKSSTKRAVLPKIDAAVPGIQKQRVLIVEDEESASKFLSFRFERAGYDVDVAKDGATGLEMAKKILPDIIILDLMLPKLPGEEVCRSIKDSHEEHLASIPIIVVTAKDSIVDKVFGKVVGADCYITKPFDFDELMKEVDRLLPDNNN